MTHGKNFRILATRGSLLEFQCLAVKPFWSWLLVIFEGEPKEFEQLDFFPIPVFPKIYNVRDAESP